HVASQHRSAHCRHKSQVGEQHGKKCSLRPNWNSRTGNAVFHRFLYLGRMKHGQHSRQREQIKTEITEELPEPHSESERDAQRTKRGGNVVAKEFWVAQQEARLRVVVGVPYGQRHDGEQQMKQARSSASRRKNFFPTNCFPPFFSRMLE